MFNVLSHTKVHIVTSLRFYLIPVRMEVFKKKSTRKSGQDVEQKETVYSVDR
jgi:hypothetical protein